MCLCHACTPPSHTYTLTILTTLTPSHLLTSDPLTVAKLFFFHSTNRLLTSVLWNTLGRTLSPSRLPQRLNRLGEHSACVGGARNMYMYPPKLPPTPPQICVNPHNIHVVIVLNYRKSPLWPSHGIYIWCIYSEFQWFTNIYSLYIYVSALHLYAMCCIVYSVYFWCCCWLTCLQ